MLDCLSSQVLCLNEKVDMPGAWRHGDQPGGWVSGDGPRTWVCVGRPVTCVHRGYQELGTIGVGAVCDSTGTGLILRGASLEAGVMEAGLMKAGLALGKAWSLGLQE